jgi:soluble lytic murein transglycosylase-like protein
VAYPLILLAIAMGATGAAVADELDGLFRHETRQARFSPRDPLAFLEDLDPILPRPVVILERQDAVARELLRYTRTMSEIDVLRVAQTLCEEADTLGWDPLMYVAVIHVESYYNHLAVSPVGAEGLMQLMPYTAEWMAEELDLEWPEGHSFDPVLNVRLGTRYLKHLEEAYFDRMDYILTAYNRGPSATRFIVSRHGDLPPDIRDFYATKVLTKYRELRARYGNLS